MPRETVRIDELHLRVPGLSRGAAHDLAQSVARKVAQSLGGDGRSARLGALEIRATAPAGTPINRLADVIAAAVSERLR
jgi:hypothetical protein